MGFCGSMTIFFLKLFSVYKSILCQNTAKPHSGSFGSKKSLGHV